MIIKQNGMRCSFGPFSIKLWKLAIAVVPKGKVHPKNGFLPLSGVEASQDLHVAQGFFLGVGRGAEQERFFPGDHLPTSAEELQTLGIGKGESFTDKAISDEQAVIERKRPLGQFCEGRPINASLFVERSYQRQDQTPWRIEKHS
jgi:hypothetical protein